MELLDITPVLVEMDMIETAVAAARAEAEPGAQGLSAMKIADTDDVTLEWRVGFGAAAGGMVAIYESGDWLELSDVDIAMTVAAMWDPAWTRVLEEIVGSQIYGDGDGDSDDMFLGLLDHDDPLPGWEPGDDDEEDEDDVRERYSPALTRRYGGSIDDSIPYLV